MRNIIFLLVAMNFLGATACATSLIKGNEMDPFLWLEEIEGKASLDWVRSLNKETVQELKSDSRFSTFETQALEILTAKDRIPRVTLRNGEVFNFWQDETHVRGLWRKTSLRDFRKKEPRWETLLDLDQLSELEKENWVAKRFNCRLPDGDQCLISLSRGGKDAVVIREFSLSQRKFINDGFILSEAKSSVQWLNENQLFVGTDFGEGSLTKSGYPRILKLWTRGEPLSKAKVVFEGHVDDVSVGAGVFQ